MSAELMLSPELKLHGAQDMCRYVGQGNCFSATETSQRAIRHGTCLGVRPRIGDFLQMLYICPVQYVSIDTESPRIKHPASYFFRQPIIEDFDCVLEHGNRPNFARLFSLLNFVFQISAMPNCHP
jgi:hypothetical protein